jgi:hypothetical protein
MIDRKVKCSLAEGSVLVATSINTAIFLFQILEIGELQHTARGGPLRDKIDANFDMLYL